MENNRFCYVTSRTIIFLLTLFLAAGVFANFEAKEVRAAETTSSTSLKLNATSYTFNSKNWYDFFYIYHTGDDDSRIVKAVSSNKKIAAATVISSTSNAFVRVTPKKTGYTTITVTDNLGRSARVKIRVTGSWAKANLKYTSYASICYSSKKVTVYAKKGTKVTIKINGRTYSKKVGKANKATINLGRHYKLNTTYKLIFKKGKLTVTKKSKVYNNTYAYTGTLWSCKYLVPMTVYNATKGDTIYLKAGSQTYSRKIYSDASITSVNFYTKYTLRNYSSLKITIKNRYKQTLYTYTRTIRWN